MDRKSESSTPQQETAVVQGQCDQYNKWLQFVKPKLANMMVVLQEQYASDGAPTEWIEWTLEKSKAMLDNDIVLILFVEHYLKNFWYARDDKEPLDKVFDAESFKKARYGQLLEMARAGKVPENVPWEYEISETAQEKVNLYMAMLCDSHDFCVLNIKNH
jgi:hypothetical protein